MPLDFADPKVKASADSLAHDIGLTGIGDLADMSDGFVKQFKTKLEGRIGVKPPEVLPSDVKPTTTPAEKILQTHVLQTAGMPAFKAGLEFGKKLVSGEIPLSELLPIASAAMAHAGGSPSNKVIEDLHRLAGTAIGGIPDLYMGLVHHPVETLTGLGHTGLELAALLQSPTGQGILPDNIRQPLLAEIQKNVQNKPITGALEPLTLPLMALGGAEMLTQGHPGLSPKEMAAQQERAPGTFERMRVERTLKIKQAQQQANVAPSLDGKLKVELTADRLFNENIAKPPSVASAVGTKLQDLVDQRLAKEALNVKTNPEQPATQSVLPAGETQAPFVDEVLAASHPDLVELRAIAQAPKSPLLSGPQLRALQRPEFFVVKLAKSLARGIFGSDASNMGSLYDSHIITAQWVGAGVDRTISNMAPEILKSNKIRATNLLSDFQQYGFGAELSSRYTPAEIRTLEYTNKYLEEVGTQAQRLGFLDTFISNYFPQIWQGHPDILRKIPELAPKTISASFARAKSRVFPDIQTAMDVFAEQARVTGDDRWLQVRPVTNLGLLARIYTEQFMKSASLRKLSTEMLNTPIDAFGTKAAILLEKPKAIEPGQAAAPVSESPLFQAPNTDLATRIANRRDMPAGYQPMNSGTWGDNMFIHESWKAKMDDLASTGNIAKGKWAAFGRGFLNVGFFMKRAKLLFDFIFHPISVLSKSSGPLFRAIVSTDAGTVGKQLKVFKQTYSNPSIDFPYEAINDGMVPTGDLNRSIDLKNQLTKIYNDEYGRFKQAYVETGRIANNAISFPAHQMFSAIERFQFAVHATVKSREIIKGRSIEEAGKIAGMESNLAVGSIPPSLMDKFTRLAMRVALLSPTWTASQAQAFTTLIGKSALTKGLPRSMKIEMMKNAGAMIGTTVATSMTMLQMLNYWKNGYPTWDKRQGGKEYLWKLKWGDKYISLPWGFWLSQIYGYTADAYDVAHDNLVGPKIKGISDLKVKSKINPALGMVLDGASTMVGNGDPHPWGSMFQKMVADATPMGMGEDPLNMQASEIPAFVGNVFGIKATPAPRLGGPGGKALKSMAMQTAFVSKEDNTKMWKFLSANDYKGLGAWLGSQKNKSDFATMLENYNKAYNLGTLSKKMIRELQPYTNTAKMVPAAIRHDYWQNRMTDEERQDAAKKIAEEGGNLYELFGAPVAPPK